jgi:hypothetical protein
MVKIGVGQCICDLVGKEGGSDESLSENDDI